MSTCAKCGTHLRSVDGVCPSCMARSITSFLRTPRGVDEEAEVPGYDLHEVIGRGGMGIVYRATRIEDSKVVAVKLLPSHLADNEEVADRFAREAHALAAFDHEHVLRVLDSGITMEGRLFLVTEFAAGGDLAKRLQQVPLPVGEAIRLYREVLSAIGEAHRQGIAHRDIKPANILLDELGGVRVGDFSLAKLLRDGAAPQLTLTQSSDVFGTPYYIAPEVRRGAGTVDERADIFSLGVLLHEMLTGRLPIGNYEPASSQAPVRARMDELIAQCLREDPAKRPQTIDSLRAAFDAALRRQVPWRGLILSLTAMVLAAAFWPSTTPTSESLTTATKAHPWTNSLGMKFVPVPGTKTLFCIWETRRSDYALFAKDHPGNANERGWEQAEAKITPEHPVTSVSWLRATQFCEWLTKREREARILPSALSYRLPRDLEWSAAAGLPSESGGTPEARSNGLGPMEHAPYPWGRSWPPPEKGFPANFAGQEAAKVLPSFAARTLRNNDGWERTAPVGAFPANDLGLYDLSGNVSEWCMDSWNTLLPDKTLRGGGYDQSAATIMRLDAREHLMPPRQLISSGFRVVIDLGE